MSPILDSSLLNPILPGLCTEQKIAILSRYVKRFVTETLFIRKWQMAISHCYSIRLNLSSRRSTKNKMYVHLLVSYYL